MQNKLYSPGQPASETCNTRCDAGSLFDRPADCSLLFSGPFVCRRKMLKLCGETQDRLAQELIFFELTIERDVVEPLYDLAEVQKSRHTATLTAN